MQMSLVAYTTGSSEYSTNTYWVINFFNYCVCEVNVSFLPEILWTTTIYLIYYLLSGSVNYLIN